MKHFTCDLIVASGDRHCEWAIFICAETFHAAAELAERHVAAWNVTWQIEEMDLQVVTGEMLEYDTVRYGNPAGVYSSGDPREVIKVRSPIERISSWLKEWRSSQSDLQSRMVEELAKLDPREERAIADEGLGNDLSSWPRY